MFGLAEGCRRIAPRIIEDDEQSWDDILLTLERWGDRRVPQTESLPFPV